MKFLFTKLLRSFKRCLNRIHSGCTERTVFKRVNARNSRATGTAHCILESACVSARFLGKGCRAEQSLDSVIYCLISGESAFNGTVGERLNKDVNESRSAARERTSCIYQIFGKLIKLACK